MPRPPRRTSNVAIVDGMLTDTSTGQQWGATGPPGEKGADGAPGRPGQDGRSVEVFQQALEPPTASPGDIWIIPSTDVLIRGRDNAWHSIVGRVARV